MPAAGGAAFTVTSAFKPLYNVQANAGADAIAFTATQTPVTQEWLLPAGTFLFRLGTLAGTGTFAVVGATVPANAGCFNDTQVFRSIIVSGTYTGQTLATGDCAFDDGSFFDVFFVMSSLPCTLTLTSAAFNPGLYVEDPFTQDFIAGVDNVGVGNSAVVSLPACRNGSDALAILTNSFTGGESGPYTLTVALQGAGALRAGESVMAPRGPPHSISAGDVVRMLQVKPKVAVRKSK
jgi:hypothetical protein